MLRLARPTSGWVPVNKTEGLSKLYRAIPHVQKVGKGIGRASLFFLEGTFFVEVVEVVFVLHGERETAGADPVRGCQSPEVTADGPPLIGEHPAADERACKRCG
jgi:hypothetical protein